MTDNKERTIKDILNDEIERKLAENPPKMLTLEEFKAMAYERLEEKKVENTEAEAEVRTVVANTKTDKKRKLYIACGAAGFVIAVMICAFAINMLTTDVGADKNPKDEIITEDGVIIKDGGWGSSEGEDNVFVVTDWKDVKGVKVSYPNLLIPQYVPKEYVFKNLVITSVETEAATAEYIFENNNGQIIEIEVFMAPKGEGSISIDEDAYTIRFSDGEAYISQDKEIATLHMDDGTLVNIWSVLSYDEIIKLAESLI